MLLLTKAPCEPHGVKDITTSDTPTWLHIATDSLNKVHSAPQDVLHPNTYSEKMRPYRQVQKETTCGKKKTAVRTRKAIQTGKPLSEQGISMSEQ